MIYNNFQIKDYVNYIQYVYYALTNSTCLDSKIKVFHGLQNSEADILEIQENCKKYFLDSNPSR